MEVHISILGPACEVDAVWGKGEGVDCTEMACDVTQVLVVDYAHQLNGETTLCRLSCCHFTSVLTTGQKNVKLLDIGTVEKGTDACSTARLYEVKYSDRDQRLGVK